MGQSKLKGITSVEETMDDAHPTPDQARVRQEDV